PGAFLVALVKPQFEVGPERIGKGGIVRDDAAREDALQRVTAWLAAQPGWRIAGTVPSPVKGGSGNVEYLVGALNDG
ncbi:MAG TPA: SAM-dependent methyltransferase, partial [Hyphomicrobium sp.]|nr:SAM-dependent methyltransferase [Hyphomicrobium sp.]